MYGTPAIRSMCVSIHALVKRATTAGKVYDFTFWGFNPRPREEGDKNCHFYPNHGQGFNPRPREEGDHLAKYMWHASLVSIHALVKRATWDIGFRNAVLQVSIHALVKRATDCHRSRYRR